MTKSTDVIAKLDGDVDVLAVLAEAHRAILLVAPRAHDEALTAVAKALLQKRSIERGTVEMIVLESDPVAKHLRAVMQGKER